MTLVFGEGALKVFDGQHVRRGDRYVVDAAALSRAPPPPTADGAPPNCVGKAWLAHELVDDARGRRYEYRGVARGLYRLVLFLCDAGVRWRDKELHGCRFCLAHGQGADLLTIFWALCGSGHLHDALKGCGEEGAGFPRAMRDRSHYVEPYACWFAPVAGCLVGGGEFGWANQLDDQGQSLAIELRRLLRRMPPDATPEELGYKLKYGVDSRGDVKRLFSRSRLEFPALHVVGTHDVHRASAERLYCMFSDSSRRIMRRDRAGHHGILRSAEGTSPPKGRLRRRGVSAEGTSPPKGCLRRRGVSAEGASPPTAARRGAGRGVRGGGGAAERARP